MLLARHADADVDRDADRRARAWKRSVVARAGSELTASLAGAARESLLVEPQVSTRPAPSDLLVEIPDPSEAEEVFAQRLARLRETTAEARVVNDYQRVIAKAGTYLATLHRPQQVRLSLAECIERALLNSYAIRVESFNPAISRTGLVEAEAAFDAVFFLDSNYVKRDEPSPSQLAPTGSDTRNISGGIRKLLPTGMQVSASVSQQRNFLDNFQFQQLNPAYESSFIVQFTQPLLRGFGLDYNRSGINLARVDRRISEERFVQRVRETLLAVETAYWNLAQARRDVMIQAETVAQNGVTYENIEQRSRHDATPVEVNNSLARWRQREVQFQLAVKAVRDAEDALKNALNDQDLKLSREVEIIPTETPFVAPLAIDQFAEARTALDERNEIREARLQIDRARIQTHVAKNETLPQLNLSFSYEVQGLGSSGDTSFDQLTTSRYQSYAVGVQFSYPIGNRAAEARLHRARLQEDQALAALNQVGDNVLREVNQSVRDLKVGYETIPPQFDQVVAANRTLRALQARTPRIDPTFLQTELDNVDQLNNGRSNLLRLVVSYNLSIVRLESAKGTLLRYNNVMIGDDLARR